MSLELATLRTAVDELATTLIFRDVVKAIDMHKSEGCRQIVRYIVDMFTQQADKTSTFADDEAAAAVRIAVNNDFQWSRVWKAIEEQRTSVSNAWDGWSQFEIIGTAVIEVTEAEVADYKKELPEPLLQEVVEIVIEVVKSFNK